MRVESRELRVESCQLSVVSRQLQRTTDHGLRTIRNGSSRLQPKASGLTLIELLITITILATLAALFLGASNAAMESARAARTKTTISKIHTLLMERLDSYTTRRVDALIPATVTSGQVKADYRLLALRELMKLEMPDRWSDVDMDQYVGNTGFFLQNIPSIALAYNRRLVQALSTSNGDRVTLDRNGSAECLYLTVMLHTGDGEARTLFSRQDIGDTDGDGAQEFLDGWGRPIRWVRWPAGFVARSDLMSGDPDTDHDPFDPFRRNSISAVPSASHPGFPNPVRPYVEHLRGTDGTNRVIGYRLVPLVFSMGPDGIGDISTRTQNIMDDTREIWLDPYAWDSAFGAYEFGSYGDNPEAQDDEDNSIDNIHNHLLDNR